MTYKLRITRHYYGPSKATDYDRDGLGDVRTWDDRKALTRYVDAQDQQVYHLAHNESSRPTYRIVKVAK